MGIENKNDVLSKAVSEVEASKGYMRLQKLFDDATFTQVDAFAKSEGGYAATHSFLITTKLRKPIVPPSQG